MNLDDMTIGQAKEIAKMFNGNTATVSAPAEDNLDTYGVGKYVIVRTYSDGVLFGKLVKRRGRDALIKNCRIIYNWNGAFTLAAVAENGVTSAKLSVPSPERLTTECISVIPVSAKCMTQLSEMKS